MSGLGCVRLLLLLDGGDGQELVGSQGVLQGSGQLPGARRGHVSDTLIIFMGLLVVFTATHEVSFTKICPL